MATTECLGSPYISRHASPKPEWTWRSSDIMSLLVKSVNPAPVVWMFCIIVRRVAVLAKWSANKAEEDYRAP